MKKFKYLFLITLIFLTACGSTKENESIIDDTVVDTKEEESKPDMLTYVDLNPVTVGIYQNGILLRDISVPFIEESDIGSFDIYFTNEENVGSSNTKYNFNRFLSNYENPEKYKIGFYISFMIGDEKKEVTVLNPDGNFILAPYLFNYLYDDIHQPDGAWYSHVESNQVTADTIYSSIKLTAIHNLNEITSPITLTAFTYDTDDDFKDGYYIGNSKYTITINRK